MALLGGEVGLAGYVGQADAAAASSAVRTHAQGVVGLER